MNMNKCSANEGKSRLIVSLIGIQRNFIDGCVYLVTPNLDPKKAIRAYKNKQLRMDSTRVHASRLGDVEKKH